MRKLELYNYIQAHPADWEFLLSSFPYYLKIKRDGGYVIFNYDQTKSDFSIPLVQEARGIIFREDNWKCVCFPFTKFFNWGEPNAAEIDWSTAEVQQKIDGCFTQKDKVLLADGTSMDIGKIVKDKLSIEVLSYNFSTNTIEPKKVIGWKKSEKTEPVENWRTIYLRGVKTSLFGKISQHCVITPTYNHMFYRKNFQTERIEEVSAGELKENDILYTPKLGLTDQEFQVVLGTLLGDGSCTYYQEKDKWIEKGVSFSHSRKQKDYVLFKANLLKKLGGQTIDKEVSSSFNPEKTYHQSLTHSGVKECYDLIYKNGKKFIDERSLLQLDWLGFAIWYMDDGSLDKSQKNNSLFLHTEGFSLEENEIIKNFYERKGFRCYVRNDTRGHYYIHFSTEASEQIWLKIREYICPSMQYKLPERHQGYFSSLEEKNDRKIILFEGKIEKIEEGLNCHNNYKAKSVYKYDIEVEDNHNYFCQGVLVHNSLIKVWYDEGWHASTNGTINAWKCDTGNIKYDNFGFLFEAALSRKGEGFTTLTCCLDKEKTYMFELVSPYNRVVIDYPAIDVYFLGSRITETGEEMPRWGTCFLGLKTPKTYNLHSLNDVVAAANALPWDEEGYVVCDDNFNRVKIKSPAYVMAHYARNNNVVTNKRLIEVILAGEVEEFKVYASDYAEQIEHIQKIKNEINLKASIVAITVCVLKEKTCCRGDFAKVISQQIDNNFLPYAFKLYDNCNLDWQEFTKDWTAAKWERFLEKFI